jgi:hypothetical protein
MIGRTCAEGKCTAVAHVLQILLLRVISVVNKIPCFSKALFWGRNEGWVKDWQLSNLHLENRWLELMMDLYTARAM